jgi:catechol 2,3-dioxygenase-like lactoylglutathione lyase family enzyme
MFKRIDHVEIVASDIERSIEFYRDTLGFEFKERHVIGLPMLKQIVYLTLGDTTLELLDFAEPAPPDLSPRGCRGRLFACRDRGPGRFDHRTQAVVGGGSALLQLGDLRAASLSGDLSAAPLGNEAKGEK